MGNADRDRELLRSQMMLRVKRKRPAIDVDNLDGDALALIGELVRAEHTARVRLVARCGVLTWLAGALMFVTGTMPVFEVEYGLWTRPVISIMGISAGLLILSGLTFPDMSTIRHALMGAGLVLAVVFDSVILIGYSAILFDHAQGLNFVGPLEPLPDGTPRPYVAVIYAYLAEVARVHLGVVIDFMRARRV